MTPERVPLRRGTGWAMTSMTAAAAAVAVVWMTAYGYASPSWFEELEILLGLAAAGLLFLIGVAAGVAAMWHSRCGRLSMTALIVNAAAVVIALLWWIWPTPRSFLDAVHRGDVAAARFALQMGVDVETPQMWGWGPRVPGHSPLTIAAGNGDEEMTRLLLEWGADVNRADGHGSYPLIQAAWSGDVPTGRLLLEAGADPTALHKKGESSALHIAAAMGHLEVIDLLLEAGVPVDLPSRDGRTPLESARMSRNDAAIEHLLDQGAQSPNDDRGAE